jgi:membrane protein YdbS with pleckstrin-like domain
MPENDTLPTTFHESNLVLAVRIVLLQLMLGLLSVVLTVTLSYLLSTVGDTNLLLTLIILLNIAIQTVDAGVLVYLILRWKNTTYSISPEHVTIQQDSLKERGRIYSASNLKEIEVEQSPLGRVLDYGTVSFHAPGLGSKVELQNIPHPWQYANLLTQNINGTP